MNPEEKKKRDRGRVQLFREIVNISLPWGSGVLTRISRSEYPGRRVG